MDAAYCSKLWPVLLIGPQVVPHRRPSQPDAWIADDANHNSNYRSLSGTYEHADDQRQTKRRPQYQFMTPPRVERRSRAEPGSYPGQSNQVILRPPHTCDLSATNHRKSYSFSNYVDSKWTLPVGTPEIRDRLDMYQQHNMQKSPNLPADAHKRLRHTTSKAILKKDHVHTLPPSNDVDSKPDNYNKDYIRLSQDYKRMAKYRINCKSDLRPACLSCHNKDRTLEKVLVPCEHVCVCTPCLTTSLPKRCPLCKENIETILDRNGYENEQYWKWVEEVSLEVIH